MDDLNDVTAGGGVSRSAGTHATGAPVGIGGAGGHATGDPARIATAGRVAARAGAGRPFGRDRGRGPRR